MTKSENAKPKDAIIILAHSVNPDGSLPAIPKYRVEQGVEQYRKGAAKKIIMSGSCGFMIDFTPVRTEAMAMKDYAMKLGVPETDILLEEDSKDTIGNAYFTRTKILDPRRWRNIAIVTSEYHLPRTEYLFKKIFGTDYHIEFIAADSHLTKEELNQKSIEEKRIITFTKRWLEEIGDGNATEIERFIREKHPGYAENPEMTKEQLREMIMNQKQ